MSFAKGNQHLLIWVILVLIILVFLIYSHFENAKGPTYETVPVKESPTSESTRVIETPRPQD